MIFKKKHKKAFTLIELIIATVIIAFIYGIIAYNYKQQYTIINSFKEKVQSVSLGQQGYNFIKYLFILRTIKDEKLHKDELINEIKSKQVNTNFYLKSWMESGLGLFFDESLNEIAPNDIVDGTYWTLKPKVPHNGKTIWAFVKINGPDDTDHMNNLTSFNLFEYSEDRIGPFYYIEIHKNDTGVGYEGNKVYNLDIIEHFIYDNGRENNNYTYKFNIDPLELK